MITNAKDRKLTVKLEQMLTTLGIEAVENHPKSGRYARVNSADKFILVMSGTVENAIMDVVSRFDRRWQWDWWNEMNDLPYTQAHNSKFAKFVNHIAEQAYGKIRG